MVLGGYWKRPSPPYFAWEVTKEKKGPTWNGRQEQKIANAVWHPLTPPRHFGFNLYSIYWCQSYLSDKHVPV